MKLARKFVRQIAHLVFPRESNNQKAKLLHSSSLMIVTLAFIVYQSILTFIPRFGPQILGYAANISPDEVIRLTNSKRQAAGLLPLEANSTLSTAAQAKGADMLNKSYWAHTAPDGTAPWKFFTDFGYKYRYAGENLARDFSNPQSAVDAWMNSASHKENILSVKYKEIGVAVVEGNLAGVDTTIIVQFFGTKYVDTIPAVPVAKAQQVAISKPSPLSYMTAAPKGTTKKEILEATPIVLVGPKVMISPFSSTRKISLSVVGVLLAVLVVDGVLVSRRKIVRIGGRTFAHVAFLGMILAVVLILKAGQII